MATVTAWWAGLDAADQMNYRFASFALACFLAGAVVRLWSRVLAGRTREEQAAPEPPHGRRRVQPACETRETVWLPALRGDTADGASTMVMRPVRAADALPSLTIDGAGWAGADEHWSPRAALAAVGDDPLFEAPPVILAGHAEQAAGTDPVVMGSPADEFAQHAALWAVGDWFGQALVDEMVATSRRWPWLLDTPAFVGACVPRGAFTDELRALFDGELVSA